MVIKETKSKEVVGGAPDGRGVGLSSFRGNFSHTLDEKSRISLPADFRVIITQRDSHKVILTNFISQGARCIEGFDDKSWQEFENNLRQKSRFNSKLQRLENFYLSRASECPIDKAGRILIPTHLRSYASLEKDVTFTSSIHGFRLWNSRIWEMVFSEAEQALLEDPDIFSDVDV